jgi:hypothetical protein
VLAQQLELLLRFDAFRDHLQLETLGQADDPADVLDPGRSQ